MTKLFKVTLKPENNKSLVQRTEYLKCSTKEILTDSIKSACAAPHSEYFGYRSVEIKEVSINSFPELMQLQIKELKN